MNRIVIQFTSIRSKSATIMMKIQLILITIGVQQLLSKGEVTLDSVPTPLNVILGNAFTLSYNYGLYTFHSWVNPTRGVLTQSTGHLTIEVNSDYSNMLVNSATFDDQGEYVCRVRNDNALLTQTITASLFETVQITTQTMLSYPAKLCETVTMRCNALYHDIVVWRKNIDGFQRDLRNSSDGHITIFSDRLMVRETELSDNGTYTCVARNRITSDYITAILHIGRELHPKSLSVYNIENTVHFTELTFTWYPVMSRCSQIYYHINSTNCGTCPNMTTATTATCSKDRNQIISSCNYGKQPCEFSIRTVVFGEFAGEQVKLQVATHPDVIQEFVNVEYDPATTSVHCRFNYNYYSNESTCRSCSISFGPGWECRNLSLTANGSSTKNNSITVDLNLQHIYGNDGENERYCLQVVANNSTFVAVLEKEVIVLKSPAINTFESVTPGQTTCNISSLSDGALTLTQSERSLYCGAEFSYLRLNDGIVCYSGMEVGSIAVYSCLGCGFKAVSESTQWSFIRLCTKEGTWNGTIPKCDCRTCLHVDILGYTVGSLFLLMLVIFISLSVVLYKVKTQHQNRPSTPTVDQVYEEVTLGHVGPDVDTEVNVSYATHRKL